MTTSVLNEQTTVAMYLADQTTSEYAHCNNFYDWFCSDKALVAKQKTLDGKVRKLAKSDKIDVDTMYVWYKNNCPMSGSLYDDIRFSDVATGNVIWTVIPKSGHSRKGGKAEVYGIVNNFEEPLMSGTWKEVLEFFGVK